MSLGLEARRRILRRAWNAFLRHRGYDSAAALTFFSALAALPALLVTVGAFSLIGNRAAAILSLDTLMGTFVPDTGRATVRDAIRELLSVNTSAAAFVVGLALTIWSVSGYTTAFGRAVDAVYDVQEGRPYWRFRGTMLIAAVPIVMLAGAAIAILLVTPTVAQQFADSAGLSSWTVRVWDIGKWPLLVVVLLALIGILYRVAPNVRFVPFRVLSAGTLLSLGIWALLTGAFSLYVVLTGSYGHFYGRLGILLVALLWVYLSNLAMMIGVQVDAELIRLRQLDEGRDAVDAILLPVKSTRRDFVLARRRDEDLAEARRIRDAARAMHRSGEG